MLSIKIQGQRGVGGEREGAGRGREGGKRGEMTQTLYAHMNKRKKKIQGQKSHAFAQHGTSCKLVQSCIRKLLDKC
jgi:hypothetical protein